MTRIQRVLRALASGSIVFALLAAGFGQGHTIQYMRLYRSVIEEKLKLSTDDPQERLRHLRALFVDAGCQPNQITEQAVPGRDEPNLMCTLPGKIEGTIIVGANSGYKDKGERGVVQWGGLAMLPILAESFGPVLHRYTLVFVAFAGPGQAGSSYYVSHLSEAQRRSTLAMIDLDSVGRTSPVYAPAQKDPTLATWLTTASRMLNLPRDPYDISVHSVMGGRGTAVVTTTIQPLGDAKPFAYVNIPAITIESLAAERVEGLTLTGNIPVTVQKTALDIQVYEDTYHTLCVFLIALDLQLGRTVAPAVAQLPPPPEDVPPTIKPQSAPVASPGGNAASPAETSTPPAASAVPGTTVASNGPPTATGPSPEPTRPPAATEQPAAPVFHAKAQLVQVDVSVIGKDGRPVQGLKQSDFTVLENGKPQEIRAFEVHVEVTAASIAAPGETPSSPPLPPHTFTNRATTPMDETICLILFDLLNTEITDQDRARKQLLVFLKGLPQRRRVALFALGTHLQMLQGFSDDGGKLAKAAEKLMTDRSLVMESERERQQTLGQTEAIASFAGPSSLPSQAGGGGGGSGPDAGQSARRERAEYSMQANRLDQRLTMTLASLEAIARTVSGYPGRKNLVWLSGSFPIELRPDLNFQNLTASTDADTGIVGLDAKRDYRARIRATTTTLANARVAVYPLDVRGQQTTGVDISLGASEGATYTDTSGAYSKTITTQSGRRFDERTSMENVADQTGGHAFIGTNDLRGAMQRSLDDGSNYYTVAYTPEDTDTSPAYRKIEVKLDQKGMKLAYRPGYYPTPQQPPSPSSFHALVLAMQPEIPASTLVTITATVLPPDANNKNVRIDYVVDTNAVSFIDAPNNRKRALVDFMVVAFDKDNKDAGHAAQTMDTTLPLAEYENALKNGLPVHQELTLPPGSYTMRLGVMDRASQKVGTMDVPIVVGAEVAIQ
jgi:VWFA-related protein